jgi:hypothetical protein
VEKVEGFAFGRGLVGVEQHDFLYEPGALQGECGTGADAASAANDCYFHVFFAGKMIWLLTY